MKYQVVLAKTITFTTEVEADSEKQALDIAFDKAPGLCHQCSLYGSKTGEVNDDAEWENLEEFWGSSYSVEQHGKTVYPA